MKEDKKKKKAEKKHDAKIHKLIMSKLEGKKDKEFDDYFYE